MECYICHKPIIGNYYIDSFNHNVCLSHIDNDVVECSSCSKFTKKDNLLPDGRFLCAVCMSIAVKSGDSVDGIKITVLNSLAKVGFNITGTDEIPIEIVTAYNLAKVSISSVNNQKGYCRFEFTTHSNFWGINEKNENYSIYILNYLSRVQFAGVLAHELLHVWQFQNRIKMPQKLAEGLCNMGSYLMYITLESSLTKSYLKALHEDPDPIYGDGFREIYKYYERLGWSGLIKHVYQYK